LGYLAASTEQIGLASGVLQIPGRTPAMTVMTAAMLDALSHGRFRLGLGISNAYITEGWHGTPFGQPLARIREYVSIVRAALNGHRVQHDGTHFQVPLREGRGEGFELHANLINKSLPIYLAAVGPRSLQLAGELADGWFGVFCSPARITESQEHLRTGRQRAESTMDGFEVMPSVPIVLHDDLELASAPIRAYVARFLSLGKRSDNFYYQLLERLGYGAAAARIQDLMWSGDHAAAAAAVPFEFIDSTALLGSSDRIAVGLRAYADAGVTTIALSPFSPDPERRAQALRVAAAAVPVPVDHIDRNSR
ncbi:MAG: LLM class flavin-dependent oxidoreductase, partial [Pseudonocardiaceae bacterium]